MTTETEIGWWVDAQRGQRASLYHGTEKIGRSSNIELLHRMAAEMNKAIRYKTALERIADDNYTTCEEGCIGLNHGDNCATTIARVAL